MKWSVARNGLWMGVVGSTAFLIRGDNSTLSDHDSDSTPYVDFIAHNKTMTCTANERARSFNNQIRGVNLGGWMVLEPWITPSLFYQFLDGGQGTTAFDIYTFCEVLGPIEGNRQLRHHWDTWVTKDIINELAATGAVNSLRLPIGDYQFIPYGPYTGCVDGGLDYVDRLLDWAYSNGLSVLLDVHTAKDSQNGFDNSGQSKGFAWTSPLSSIFAGFTTFEHWPIRTADWVGTFDTANASYANINYANINHSLAVVEKIVERYGGHPAVLGIEPLNEPWEFTPIDVLKRFYWEGYLITNKGAPYWKYIMHDSFRFDTAIWGGFMHGCPERALDTHIYQAWATPAPRLTFYTDACSQKARIADMEREFGPVIVGEWSLATDNCAMWLNGFNDNLPGFPRWPCKYEPCGESYLGTDQPGVPIDPAKPMRGPFGTGMSGPIFGLCPATRDWLKESSGNPFTGQDWIRAPPKAPKRLDDTDDVMTNLALKKLDAFSGIGHGYFFWNFRTDLYQPQWSYMDALDRGWIPRGSLLHNDKVKDACLAEDNGEFKCVLKNGQLEKSIYDAVAYVFTFENRTDTPYAQKVLSLTGADLEGAARPILSAYFDKYRLDGATCDFGGVCMLIEQNKTLTDSIWAYTDDEYFGAYIITEGPSIWEIVVSGVAIALVAGLCGFVTAMRSSPNFNRKVRESKMFRPISRTSNQLLRSSLKLPDVGYEEIKGLTRK